MISLKCELQYHITLLLFFFKPFEVKLLKSFGEQQLHN